LESLASRRPQVQPKVGRQQCEAARVDRRGHAEPERETQGDRFADALQRVRRIAGQRHHRERQRAVAARAGAHNGGRQGRQHGHPRD